MIGASGKTWGQGTSEEAGKIEQKVLKRSDLEQWQ